MTDRRRPRLSRRRAIAFGAVALAFGLLAGLLVAELGIRLYLSYKLRGSLERLPTTVPVDPNAPLTLGQIIRPDDNPKIVYRLKPGARGVFEGAPLRANSHGFRGPEFAIAKPPGTFRLLSIGDSNTFGWGVREEETYTAALERALRVAAPDGLAVEAINLGVPGYNSVQEVENFFAFGASLDPDAVLALLDVNDALLPVFLTDRDVWRLDRLYAKELRNVFNPAFFTGEARFEIHAEGKRPDGAPGMMVAPDESAIPKRWRHLYGWDPLEASYRRLAAECAARDVPLRVVFPAHTIFEFVANLDRDYDYERPRELLAELGVPVVDLYPEARRIGLALGLATADFCIRHPFDTHPNPFRHALLARELYPTFAALLPGFEAGGERDRAARRALDAEVRARFAEKEAATRQRWNRREVLWTGAETRLLLDGAGGRARVEFEVAPDSFRVAAPGADGGKAREVRVEVAVRGGASGATVATAPGPASLELAAPDEPFVLATIRVAPTFRAPGGGPELGVALPAALPDKAAR